MAGRGGGGHDDAGPPALERPGGVSDGGQDGPPPLLGPILTLRRAAIALMVGGGSFAVYASTIFPSLPGGDATELAFCACQRGVSHPPGYPLFTMIASLFVDYWPYGSPALKANMAGAACGAGAASLLFLAAETITKSEPTAVLVAGMFAMCKLVWFYSIQSEVFSLNNMITAALLWVLALFDERGDEGLVYLGAILCGLGLTNQHTIIFYVAPVILYVSFQVRDRMLTPGKVAGVILAFFLGLTPYAYLPYMSGKGLPGSWGATHTLDGFFTHLLRKEYGTFRLFSGADQTDSRFWMGMERYGWSLLEQSRYVGGALMAVGFVLVFARPKSLPGMPVILSAGWFYTCAFHGMANLPIESPLYLGVHARFWMQSFVAAFLVMGVGAAALFRAVGLQSRPAVAWVVVLACIGSHVAVEYRGMDESENTVFADYGKTLLDPLPQGARMIVKGDVITNSVRYLQQCEGYRADVEVVDQAMLTYQWFIKVQGKNFPSFIFPGTHYHPYEETSFSMKQLVDANYGDGSVPLFMAGGWHEEDFSHQGFYEHQPYGMVDKVTKAGLPLPDYEHWYQESTKLLPNYTLPAKSFGDDRWEAICIRDYYQTHHKVAFSSLNHAMATNDPRGFEDTRKIIEWAIANHPPPIPSYYFRNLGIAYQRLTAVEGKPARKKTLHDSMIRAFKDYLKIAPPTEGGYADVQRLVQTMSI